MSETERSAFEALAELVALQKATSEWRADNDLNRSVFFDINRRWPLAWERARTVLAAWQRSLTGGGEKKT